MTFDERKAIEIEIANLKEQTRMDYELYFESRKIRNEQITMLLNRLRELDERDRDVDSVGVNVDDGKTTPNTIDEWVECKNNKVGQEHATSTIVRSASVIEQLREQDKRKNVKSNIVKGNVSSKVSKRPSMERVESVVVSYLKDNGEVRLGELRKYVEGELNRHWQNFSSVMKEIMSKNEMN